MPDPACLFRMSRNQTSPDQRRLQELRRRSAPDGSGKTGGGSSHRAARSLPENFSSCASWVPKKGNKTAEYEDAFCLPTRAGAARKCVRFAVADGATEASYSRIWATQLVRAFVRGRIPLPLELAPLRTIQKHWARMVHRQPLPWYAEEKARSGAFSSLIGIEFTSESPPGGRWQATAVGDSCLVHIRDNQLIAAFPLNDSSLFGSRVTLISSDPGNNHDVPAEIRETAGTWNPGDTFFLMTDAVAAWFFKQVEQGIRPWIDLNRFGHPAMAGAFPEWVDELRGAGQMKNDDVTVVRIQATE